MTMASKAPCHGALVPAAAVASVFLVLVLLGGLVDLDRASVPKPPFKELMLEGYPAAIPLDQAALIVEAALWWLCLSFLLWTTGLATIGLCVWQLHRATRHVTALARLTRRLVGLVVALAIALLSWLVLVRGTSLLSFGPLVGNLAVVSAGFVHLTTFNAALVFVVGTALLLSVSLLMLPGAHADQPSMQMEAITGLMYGGAVFLFVWVAAATSMYRLAATLLVAPARDAALRLAPTISLMGGLFLSLLLAAAYVSACVWLQRRHDQWRLIRMVEDKASTAAGPVALLTAHWPKVVAILMPLLPGAAGSVLQAMVHAP